MYPAQFHLAKKGFVFMPETTAENVKQTESQEEWDTVSGESGSPIAFDIGTQFIGTFLGVEHIVPPNSKGEKDEFDQARFSDSEGLTRTINLGYKLAEALAEVEPGSKVRITRMDDVPTKDPAKNAMKDFRVEVAR
jgi:hypothetical protein